MVSVKNYLSAKIFFKNEVQIKKTFELLLNFLSQSPTVYHELDLKLMWTSSNLSSLYQKLMDQEIRKLVNLHEGLNLRYNWPYCLVNDLSLDLGQCESCQYQKSGECHWYYQVRDGYNVAPQPSYTGDIEKLSLKSFQGHKPITWFVPAWEDVFLIGNLCNEKQFLDFGCGNAFVDSLILDMHNDAEITGVDSNQNTNYQHERFFFSKELGHQEVPETLLSIMPDQNVPIEKLLKERSFKNIIFIYLPEIFGNPGQMKSISIEEGKQKLIDSKEMFSFDQLIKFEYKKVYEKTIRSFYSENAKMMIFSQNEIDVPTILSSMPEVSYLWERQ